MDVHRGILLLWVTSLAAAVVTTGCGNGRTTTSTAAAPTTPEQPVGSADLARGRRLFQTGVSQSCGFCHTLRSAETVSPIAVDLNAEMQETGFASWSDGRLAKYVLGWIDRGDCLNPTDATRCMPRRIVSGADALAVADFVAVCGRRPEHSGCAPVAGALRGNALRGEHLFQTRGCVSCHFTNGAASTGPPLVGVAGSRVELADGKGVTADDAYLRASLAAPDSQIVLGYQSGTMSAWVKQQHLTRAEIDALVDYIKTLR
jgi:mono/diheme cytochrome c family protein